MSMPQVVHPWSQSPSSFGSLTAMPGDTQEPTPESAPQTGDLAAVASALFAAGFVASAVAIAELGGDAAQAAIWRQTSVSDRALADTITRTSVALIPSVTVTDSGAPRFVVSVADAERAVAAVAREHGDHGVDAELRLFLDEVLRDGDRYVDAAPGDGFAAMTAASGAAVASVIVLCEDAAHCAALETSARGSNVAATVTVRESDSLAEVPLTPAVAGGMTIVHAGSAASVAPLLTTARAALERGDIGAVAWRCGRADETGRDAESLQIAAAVLGMFGFEHFALADGESGTELVPAEAMASNEMIFSLSPGFLARFAA